MAQFADKMKMSDGVEVQLECGHPHTKPGEQCKNCGKLLPPTRETKDHGPSSGESGPGAG